MTVHQTIITQAATPAEQRFLDLYAEVAGRLPGAQHEIVRAWRDAAIGAFASAGLPHRRVEAWKYTDLRQLMPEVLPLAGLGPQAVADIGIAEAIGADLASLDCHNFVFVNGVFRADLSSGLQIPGIVFNSFNSFREGAANYAAQIVPQLAPHDGDAVSALSAAFATDGALIAIEEGAKLEKPLHLIFLTHGASPVATALQNMIRLGAGAEAALIETHVSTLPSHSYATTRIEIGENANLSHIRLALGGAAKNLSSIIASLSAGSQYNPFQMTLGGALSRAQSFIRFDGEGGRCHFTGAAMQRGNEHSDMTLIVDHAAAHCESRELVKAVLDGRAKGVFQAKVLVRPGAQKTDGKQMANALLLSDDAEFDSKPELEIYADDVVCGHGATTGQLDEDMLFYLRARGIPESEARALLVAAFIGEALDKIEHEALRETLKERVNTWFAAQ